MEKNILKKLDMYLGFLDDKAPRRAGQIKKVLTKNVRIGREVMEKRDNILYLVLGGSQTYSNENYGSYGIYVSGNSGIFYDITKTEWEFANYLIDAGLTTEEVINDKVQAELRKRKREADKARKAKEDAERKRIEEVEFMRWLDDKALTYEPNNRAKLQDEIFADIYGDIQPFQRRSLVLIDHFDDPVCKGHLCPYLITQNKGTRKLFECLTGLKLPKTNKETQEFIAGITSADFKDPIPYKKRRQPKEKELERFYTARNGVNGTEYDQVMGKGFRKYGMNLFFHEKDCLTIISNSDTGFKITDGVNQKDALEKLKKSVEKNGKQLLQDKIAEVGEKYGWSPWSYEQKAI